MNQNHEQTDLQINSQTPEEIVLNFHFKDAFLRRFIFGFLYGLAIIVPGISGAAVSIIFKLYDQLIYAVSNLFKHFKKCILYLIPIGIGVVIGLVVGLLAIQQLLKILPFSVVMLFFGLMIGAFPAVSKEIKGNPKNIKNVSFFILGLIIPILILALTLSLNFPKVSSVENFTSTAEDFFKDFPISLYLLSIPIGMVVGLTQVVPGLSASAFLMMIGWFNPLMDCLHREYLMNHPKIFIIIAILILCFLIGFFLSTKMISYTTKKNRVLTYQVIVGLSLGSILTMIANPEVITIYLGWHSSGIQGTQGLVDVILAAPLLLLGIGLSYFLVRYEEKKKQIS